MILRTEYNLGSIYHRSKMNLGMMRSQHHTYSMPIHPSDNLQGIYRKYRLSFGIQRTLDHRT